MPEKSAGEDVSTARWMNESWAAEPRIDTARLEATVEALIGG